MTLPSKIYNFVVADNVRQEDASGKAMIIGAFSAGKILFKGKPSFPVATPLAFFIVFKDGEGFFDAKFRVIDPSNKTVIEHSLGRVEKKTDQGLQLLVNIPILPIVSVGNYKVEITLDGHSYEDGFSVGLAD